MEKSNIIHQVMQDTDIAWLAGIIEGEGTLAVRVRSGRQDVQIQVGMCDEDIILRCQNVSGVGSVGGPYRNKGPDHWKPFWRWIITRKADIAWLVNAIYPYLGTRRRDQADKVLAAIGPHPDLRHTNTSGYSNVWRTPSGRWRARVRMGDDRIHLGMFATAELAAVAVRDYEKEYG